MIAKDVDVVIVGGGAAGFFCANILMENNPDLSCLILEKSSKVLSKVKVSGGGRCNVTNQEDQPKKLSLNYPRGEKFLLPLFKRFGSRETKTWFENNDVLLKTESDGRVFPESNISQTIVDLLYKVTDLPNCSLQTSTPVTEISQDNQQWVVSTDNERFIANHLVMATGGMNKAIHKLMTKLAVKTITTAPSLFTFKLNIEESILKEMQGVAIQETQTKIVGSKYTAQGPLLFTHWGLSGPAILKLSSWGAKILAEKNYKFTLHINFTNLTFEETKNEIEIIKIANTKKLVKNVIPFDLPKRAWHFILNKASIDLDTLFIDISGKKLNKLTTELSQCELHVDGKSTFKEEFVTAGGIDLNDITRSQCEHKTLNNLYFTGELLDIDAITGGFNFQAAWTTAYTVAKTITNKEINS